VSELSPARIAELLAESETETDRKAKGNLLESLAVHILGSIPGVKVTGRDVLNVHRSEEVDLVLMNSRRSDGLEFFGPFILAECKNLQEPVDSESVGAFARKLESRRLGLGILVARFGVTGNPEKRNAAQHVISQQLTAGREIVVITARDLEKLKTSADVVDLLLRRRSSLLATCGFVEEDDWYVDSELTEDSEASVAENGVRKGWRGVRDAVRIEQERVAEEMLSRAPELPDDLDDATSLLVDATNELQRLLDLAKSDEDDDDLWTAILDRMSELGAVGTAFLGRHGGWERDPGELVASIQQYMPNIRHVGFSSSLFRDMVTHYSLETVNEEELDGRTASLALIGLMVDSHWRLEESLYEFRSSGL
jgi:hypothetical protein